MITTKRSVSSRVIYKVTTGCVTVYSLPGVVVAVGLGLECCPDTCYVLYTTWDVQQAVILGHLMFHMLSGPMVINGSH